VLKTCRVSYRDPDRVTHTVDVTASSLYEAAVLAIKAFEIAEWVDLPRGSLEISVTSPAVKHEVSIAKVTNWLQAVRTPQDQILKNRLREILGWRD
jgi:hypothetical protein